ncbi:leucine-rich repeat domain-containing protein [Ruminococcus difficilis]|uniref:Leucine-rich repeat domain-containing protein n=1 Tax=Ruminococcus difficilis TaxID=2763069 RepID=A0A935C390_9FIRM|nr:leucine-rich repeat domain-containing protein [Ruminococcus difficilis]MBK6089625.1 leucine-rich repeat domain-containing protein [Ruminococcus difficilis]
MAEYEIIPKAILDAIEESIKRKRGETAPISPSQMPLAIDTIPSSVDGTDVPVGGIYFTKPDSNGNPTECYIIGYAPNAEYTWTSQIGYSYFPYLKKVSFVNCLKIASIGTSAFQSCASLTAVNFPNSIASIGTSAFQSCASLTAVNFPNSITSIGTYAFQYCASLTAVNFPNSIASIGADAFYGCTSLTDVTIESGFNCNGLNLSASTQYTTETIVSWLESLADRTGQATFKLTVGKTNLNKLTAEQKAIATNKNWTLA